MLDSHYGALVAGYAVAIAGWLMVARIARDLWPATPQVTFTHPWRAVGAALLSVVGVLLLGQLYVRGWRLPSSGAAGPLLEAINQTLIFSPVLLMLVVRREPAASAWLATRRLPARLAAGAALAVLALLAYTLVRRDADALPVVLLRIASWQHLDVAVQVLLEDITIAVLFVRLAAAIGVRPAIGLVALLFAVAHIPTMVAEGASTEAVLLLGRDVLLGVALIMVVQRSRDIVWFWLVHFAMDMTQFRGVISGG